MTTNDTEQFMRSLRAVRMPASEREALRHTLVAYAQTYVPRPSALAFFMRHAIAFSALALVLVAGGTVVTAHDSLPGSPLYAMKAAVSDRIALATAPDDDARLDAELRQIERALADEERALAQEPALADEAIPSRAPSLAPTPSRAGSDDVERDLRELEQELKDIERDSVPEV